MSTVKTNPESPDYVDPFGPEALKGSKVVCLHTVGDKWTRGSVVPVEQMPYLSLKFRVGAVRLATPYEARHDFVHLDESPAQVKLSIEEQLSLAATRNAQLEQEKSQLQREVNNLRMSAIVTPQADVQSESMLQLVAAKDQTLRDKDAELAALREENANLRKGKGR